MFETLNLEAFAKLWGRKVSDLAFADFLLLLQWIAKRRRKIYILIDRWFPSSKLCHACGSMNEALKLEDRPWRRECGRLNGRDRDAVMNFKMEGAPSIGLEDARLASASDPCLLPESHGLFS